MKLTIGKIAQQSNVTVETIRHYQGKKLLREPEKPTNGFMALGNILSRQLK